MRKTLILGLMLLSVFLLVSCTTDTPTEDDKTTVVAPTDTPTEQPTEQPTDTPTEQPTDTPTEGPTVTPVDPEKEKYGELIIPDMKIYTEFPDTPQPVFTKPEHASEITYTVVDNNVIKYEDGYFSANRASVATVEAKTEHHSTTFTVTSEVYTDKKGVETANWYLGRVNSVEGNWLNDGKPTGGTLFIGDSFFDTEFWSDFYQLYGGNENVYTHGVSSSTTTDWEIFAKRLVYPVAPKNIVMHLGTNNLYDDRETVTQCVNNTKRLLEEFHARLPETKVYYFAIEPRGYAIGGGNFNQASYDFITAVNDKMKAYCEANEHLVFVDATSYCYTEGIKVNLDFFRDQTHPKLENYLIYHELLVEAGLDLSVDTSFLNTTSFDIALTEGVASTNNLIRVNGEALTNNFSVSGKLKITSAGNNPHIQFSLDNSNFNNRFLLWDNDTNGSYKAAYAFNGAHKAASGRAEIFADQEVAWEVVVTEKHAYFYVEGELEFVFLNINAEMFVIGAEKVGVSFYDIAAVTNKDAEAWANVLAREEIAKYENSDITDAKAEIYVKEVPVITTESFEIAQTTGVAATNQQILVNGEAITHNYAVSGKLKIGTAGNNPHIQFSLDDTNFQNRFLLWDNDTNGSFVAAYAFGGSHKQNSGKASVVAGEEVVWELVTTEKHSYFYINGELEFVFLNFNARSLVIGAEKTQVSVYDIQVVIPEQTEAWAAVLARIPVAYYEASSDEEAKAIVYDKANIKTTGFEIAETTGVAATNQHIIADAEYITHNYSVSGKLNITSGGNNPHIQFSLDDSNFNNRFLLWDNDTNGSFVAAYAFAGSHKAGSGKASVAAGEEVAWELVTTEKHSYFYINGKLEFVFLNFNARSLVIGAEKTAVSFYDINTVTSANAEAWAAVLAREEIAEFENSEDTEAKAIVYVKVQSTTTEFDIPQTVGINNTNREILVDNTPLSNNYAVSGKLKIGTADKNPHIQFLLAANNRFLLWDNDNNGTFVPGYQHLGTHKNNIGKAAPKAGEEVAWELVTTEKHAYFYVNGVLEFIFLNINSTSLNIGAEKTQVSFYEINTITKEHNADAWAEVLNRGEIYFYENSAEAEAKVVKYDSSVVNTTAFDIAKTTGVAATNHFIVSKGNIISNNYSVSGKLTIGECDTNPNIQFSLDGNNGPNRFLLWDNNTDGTYISSYAFQGNYSTASGQASVVAGQEITWEVVTTEKHSYFYINGQLEFVFLNFNAKMLVIGAEKVAINVYDIKTVTSADADAWANVLARSEVAKLEATESTELKAWHADTKVLNFDRPAGNGTTGRLGVYRDGEAVTAKYAISGKLKIASHASNNPHFSFFVAGTTSRFILWDNNGDGTFNAAYNFAGKQVGGLGKELFKVGEEITWEVVATEKHAYFYVNGRLELVLLNANTSCFEINCTRSGVQFYDINVTLSTDTEAWASVLAREEVASYEASTETEAKAVVVA